MVAEVEQPQGPDAEQAAGRRTLYDVKRIFVFPEVERRRLAGAPVSEDPRTFQIIWAGTAQAGPTVRLNEEVRALLRLDVPTSSMQLGDLVHLDETANVVGVHLLPEEERCAHFTAFSIGRRTYFNFDFRYQKQSARDHLAAAEEFLLASRNALAAGHQRAFLENAHSCAELSVKIGLLLLSQIGEGRVQHPEIRRKAAPFQHLEDARTLLEELAQVRLPARYLVGNLEFSSEKLGEMLTKLEGVIEGARGSVAAAGPAA